MIIVFQRRIIRNNFKLKKKKIQYIALFSIIIKYNDYIRYNGSNYNIIIHRDNLNANVPNVITSEFRQ